jgi:DNA-directed RNA polymerase subunit K/omega
MDYKKTNAPTNTVTRNLMDLSKETNNIYESISVIGKRANQISATMKEELTARHEND